MHRFLRHPWPCSVMAKSKEIHLIDYESTLVQGDGNTNWDQGYIQVDQLLSQKFGKQIRNGNNFRLVGYGATLRSYDGGPEFDIGAAATVGIKYCPTTKEGCDAWRYMFQRWKKQKQLAGTIGRNVRYDDLEMGWSDGVRLASARQSTIKASGLGDNVSEDIVLYGSNVNNDVISLENTWYNVNPIAQPSEDWLGSDIKDAKFFFKFPQPRTLYASSTFSAGVNADFTPDAFQNGVATNTMTWLPTDNHISHMTGTLFWYLKGVPIDTISQNADQLKICITLAYEGWNKIAKTPKRRKMRGKKKSTYRYSKYRKMGYKRPYRRRYKRRS